MGAGAMGSRPIEMGCRLRHHLVEQGVQPEVRQFAVIGQEETGPVDLPERIVDRHIGGQQGLQARFHLLSAGRNVSPGVRYRREKDRLADPPAVVRREGDGAGQGGLRFGERPGLPQLGRQHGGGLGFQQRQGLAAAFRRLFDVALQL